MSPERRKKYAYDKIDRNDAFDCRQKIHKALHYPPPNLFMLRWLERVLVFFDALYLGVKIFRLELANHDQILPQNNDKIKVSIFCRFLKKFVAMAMQLGFEAGP